MKKYLILGLIIILFGCGKNEIDTDGKVIWKPNPVALINNNEVRLNWFDNSIYNEIFLPYEIVDPDQFEIYISRNDYPNFTKLIKLGNDKEYSYTITGLDNNQPVYFYVTSLKKGFDKLISDTIMVIPNKEITPIDLAVQSDNHTIVSVSTSHSIDRIAYVDKYYSWNGGENCCMSVSILISSINGSQSELLDINAYEPCWSPDDNRIVFRTENNEINLGNGIPSQIALYDCSSKSITKLTDDTVFNYAPVFSENGEMLLYQSTKGVPDIYSTNIWLINLSTLEKTQLTNLENSELINFGRTNWIDNESYVFHATQKNYKNQIYKSMINSNVVEKVIESDWNDYCPTVSPNDKMIAFISDRSGSNQIWIYNIDTHEYKQITGYSNDVYISESWTRIEWIDNQNITFTLNENRFVEQRIE
jgi:Tol biopolymer transport system component